MAPNRVPPGPIEAGAWPAQLTTHAVVGSRLAGYDVPTDLSLHYRFSDIVYLALVGELPSDAASQVFEVALTFASTMSPARSPVHATMLARLCGVRAAGVLSVAALALGEEYEPLVARVAAIVEALPTRKDLADDLRATSDEERALIAALRSRVGQVLPVPILDHAPSLDVALVGVLMACGLREVFPIVAALVLGGLPSALAEARATVPADFRNYPMNTPPFAYDPAPSEDAP